MLIKYLDGKPLMKELKRTLDKLKLQGIIVGKKEKI